MYSDSPNVYMVSRNIQTLTAVGLLYEISIRLVCSVKFRLHLLIYITCCFILLLGDNDNVCATIADFTGVWLLHLTCAPNTRFHKKTYTPRYVHDDYLILKSIKYLILLPVRISPSNVMHTIMFLITNKTTFSKYIASVMAIVTF